MSNIAETPISLLSQAHVATRAFASRHLTCQLAWCLITLHHSYSPARADLVAALGETTGEAAFKAVRERMRRTESGRELLRLRPRITVSRPDNQCTGHTAACRCRSMLEFACKYMLQRKMHHSLQSLKGFPASLVGRGHGAPA